ncbi:MAG: hypothetical protein OHK0022_12650 [Roseiflexaceae bacterium]
MNADLSDILEICEKLVNHTSERKRFKANPQQYLKKHGLPKLSPTKQVSTVITLDIKAKGGKKTGPKKWITDKVCLSTDSDVLLVEVPKETDIASTVLEQSWLEYQDGELAFVVHIQFDQAIPENPNYKPILRIAYNDQGRTSGTPFTGTLITHLKQYILVKKYCSFYVNLGQSSYDPDTDLLRLNFDQRGDPTPAQQSGCHDPRPPSQQAD